MADVADMAGDVIEATMAKALAGIKSTTGLPSLESCRECGDDIPKERQQLGGVTRCASCQEVIERINKNARGTR